MNENTEFQLIRAILNEGSLEDVRKSKVNPSFLLHPTARKMLEVIFEYASKPSTLGKVPALEYLHTRGLYVPDDIDFEPTTSIEGLCQAFVVRSLRKMVQQGLTQIQSVAATNPAYAVQLLRELASDSNIATLTSEGEGGTFSQGFSTALDRYKNTALNAGIVGLDTPFPTLTKAIRGWRRGHLYIIFAPAKSYKTWVGLQCIADQFNKGKRVMVISTEMTQDEMDDRLLCLTAKVNYNQFLTGALDGQTMLKLEALREQMAARVNSDIIHWRPSGRGAAAVAEVRAKIKEHNHDGQLALVLWDGHYKSAAESDWNAVYDLTRDTKAITIDKSCGEVPIIVTTQEGSKVGEASYRVYEQEANVVFRLTKIRSGAAALAITHIREGRACALELKIDFAQSTIVETKGQLEDTNQSLATTTPGTSL